MTEKNQIHPYVNVLYEQLENRRIGRRDFLRTATLLGLSASAAYAVAGMGGDPGLIPSARAQEPVKGGTLRLAMRLGDIKDPHTYSWGQGDFMRQTLEHLTLTGIDNVTRPLLLEGWEPSADLKTWILRIRRDVTWHSGRPLVADDVIWNLKHALDPATGSATVGLMAGYMLERYDTGEKDDKGQPKFSRRLWDANAIEKVDDYTVRLNAKVPNLAVPEHLYHHQLFMMDPDDGGEFGIGANFTGPYQIVSYEQGKRAVMTARANYWGGAPHVETLELLDLGDNAPAAMAALAADQIDGWPSVDNASLQAVRTLDGVNVYEAHTANTGAVRVRPEAKPFDDPRVRKAMRLAIDCQSVLDLGIGGLGTVGEHHLVSRTHPDYGPVPPLPFDPGAAKKLLAEAGFPNGIDSEVYLKSSPAWESQVVQSMVEQWSEVGIRIKMNPVPSTQYWEVWKKVPVGFTDWNHRPLGIMLLGLCFRTDASWNESGYSNPEFDRLLVEAEGKVSIGERKAAMGKLQTILLEDGPIIQPVFRSIFGAYRSRVKNFTMHPTNFNYYKDVWLEA